MRGFGGGRAPKARADRVEAPQAPRGWYVGRGCPPPHWGKGLGMGQCPSPEFFFDFWSPNSDFWCIVGAIFTVQWTVLDADSRCMTVLCLWLWLVSLQVPELSMHWRTTVKEWAARIITSCADIGPALFTIAGLFHFRCDASLITQYRPYASTPWCWTVTLIPCATLLYSQKYMLQYRLVVFHYELHL